MSSGLVGRTRSRSPVVELHFENRGGTVRIVPPGNDIMAMSVETAIEACRAFKTQILFKNQFDMLVPRLVEWLESHPDKIAEAYLTIRDSGLLFLIVTCGKHIDEEIEAALTELDLEIAHDKDLELINLSVHAIPQVDGGAESFVSKKMALRFVRNGVRD